MGKVSLCYTPLSSAQRPFQVRHRQIRHAGCSRRRCASGSEHNVRRLASLRRGPYVCLHSLHLHCGHTRSRGREQQWFFLLENDHVEPLGSWSLCGLPLLLLWWSIADVKYIAVGIRSPLSSSTLIVTTSTLPVHLSVPHLVPIRMRGGERSARERQSFGQSGFPVVAAESINADVGAAE